MDAEAVNAVFVCALFTRGSAIGVVESNWDAHVRWAENGAVPI